MITDLCYNRSMSEKHEPTSTLDNLIEIIKQTVAPDQVILFGSQSKGTAGTESDYDFLVVVPNVENERHISRCIYRALLDHQIGVAVDIIVVDTETLAQRRDTPGLIYKQALAEGKVCYDRARL